MASGKAHARASLVTAFTGAVLLGASGTPVKEVFEFALGGLVSVLLSPDLDHPSGYIGLKILRSFPGGRLLASIWWLYWLPYRLFLGLVAPGPGWKDGHRHFLSHLPGVGTLLRIAWLFLIPWLICGFFFPPPMFVLAILISDILHSIMDSVRWR